mmetsp:Transcript_56941/g.137665  ORF Transcript_56941/g.137665 Transcript_56941/m.137665 type:complete len:263 (-) Transcript_56941:759-1547(-)
MKASISSIVIIRLLSLPRSSSLLAFLRTFAQKSCVTDTASVTAPRVLVPTLTRWGAVLLWHDASALGGKAFLTSTRHTRYVQLTLRRSTSLSSDALSFSSWSCVWVSMLLSSCTSSTFAWSSAFLLASMMAAAPASSSTFRAVCSSSSALSSRILKLRSAWTRLRRSSCSASIFVLNSSHECSFFLQYSKSSLSISSSCSSLSLSSTSLVLMFICADSRIDSSLSLTCRSATSLRSVATMSACFLTLSSDSCSFPSSVSLSS